MADNEFGEPERIRLLQDLKTALGIDVGPTIWASLYKLNLSCSVVGRSSSPSLGSHHRRRWEVIIAAAGRSSSPPLGGRHRRRCHCHQSRPQVQQLRSFLPRGLKSIAPLTNENLAGTSLPRHRFFRETSYPDQIRSSVS